MPQRADPLGASTPVPKRRKISFWERDSHEVVGFSTSSSSSDEENRTRDDQKKHVSEDEDDETISLPDVSGLAPGTRFKASVRPQGLKDSAQARRAFRTGYDDHRQSVSALSSTLPEAFSPSRRKGKKGYVAGGNADVVRNWVLQAAAEELQSGARNGLVLWVSSVQKDPSGRFALVSDGNGVRWLLISSQGKTDVGSQGSDLDRIHVGDQLLVKGGATRWTLPDTNAGVGDLLVCVQWDVIK